MTEELRKELIGEFYIDSLVSCRDKDKIINCINGFINTLPSFKPLLDINRCNSKMLIYCKNNNMKILDPYYFIKNPSYNINSGDNSLCICVDENNIKHVLVIRGYYGEVKKINNKLGYDTLRSIYKALVYNIINYQLNIRNIKEIKTFVKCFNCPKILKLKLNEYEEGVYFITKMNFDDNYKSLRWTCSSMIFNNRTGFISHYNSENKSQTSIEKALEFTKNENYISYEDVENMIDKYQQIELQHVLNKKEKLLNFLNSIKVN